MSTLTDLTINYLAAVAAKDLDTVVSFFNDNVELSGPGGNVSGKSAVRTAIGDLVNPVGEITLTITEMYEKNTTVVAETAVVTDVNTVYNVHVITFTDEKISGVKLYTL